MDLWGCIILPRKIFLLYIFININHKFRLFFIFYFFSWNKELKWLFYIVFVLYFITCSSSGYIHDYLLITLSFNSWVALAFANSDSFHKQESKENTKKGKGRNMIKRIRILNICRVYSIFIYIFKIYKKCYNTFGFYK